MRERPIPANTRDNRVRLLMPLLQNGVSGGGGSGAPGTVGALSRAALDFLTS